MQQVQLDSYEYRKGRALKTWHIWNPAFDITVAETTSVIRMNGVVFSREKLAKCWKSRNKEFSGLAELICLAWQTAIQGELTKDAPDWAHYTSKKMKRLFDVLGVKTESMDAKLTLTMMPFTKDFNDPEVTAKVIVARQ